MPKTLKATQTGFFQLLGEHDGSFDPSKCRVHLASTNELNEVPIDEYRAGRFESWQARQDNENFNRDYVISLIQLPTAENHWLFEGVHSVEGFKENQPNANYLYSTTRCVAYDRIAGKVIVEFSAPSKQSCVDAESHEAGFKVIEIRPERYQK